MKIIVDKVSKRFKKKEVLKNVNLEFESGKIYGIVGGNGSGKTVLLKMILGLSKPSTGEIKQDSQVLGQDIKVLTEVGAVIETPTFYEELSGIANLKLFADINSKVGIEEINKYIDLFELVIDDVQPVKEYSLGMRQKTALVQAFMENPKVLILDEPTNGLDSNTVKILHDAILKKKEEGCLVIVTSHNTHDIESLCDIVYKVVNGEVMDA